MNTQKLEQVPIDKLVPYARNARTHSKEQIAQLRASLREFGFVSPAVIDADYNILVGHGRITAAREEGYETVPCVFAENLTEAQNSPCREPCSLRMKRRTTSSNSTWTVCSEATTRAA